ncbi:NAD-dependent epimerase/dehydratase family protein [Nesterenkonia lacusekhoensis]|uniref:NAD-dependent epimerase/dehydratase family protein n=1 Tax=Nesterenkonia lacusekhoensis TaxID=150832 RepID=UPI001AEA84E0|nr:NAD-dependent epimerase/dehydratase family protein [Nesterenkonia lacusekhoensis]
MRIAVVGATGNLGTAVLNQLQSTPEVASVLGIARRLPDVDAAPYSGAQWLSADIQFEESRSALAEAFASVDSVIHLAWLIQPNKERDLLRRVNVDGTRHVLEAAEKAGVGHIAVASSVGAYSPVDDDRPRGEDWPTGGIPTSHYSVDKAAQERVLDEFAQAHPEIAVAGLRPGLIFQASAGAEIQRYFAGTWAPVQVLSSFRPPVLPLPKGLRTQAVHADDVAAAFVQAVVRRAHGAFNICADDLLTAETISQIVGQGRHLDVPGAALRPLLRAAHRARVIPMDEGWLDIAHRVPVMDSSRAEEQLGWRPQKSAAQALEELIHGMARGSGTESVPLRPRSTPVAHQRELPGQEHRLPQHVDALLLRQYMADHLAGATAGLDRILQMAENFVDTPVYPEVSAVAEGIRSEHAFLQELMKRQGFPRPPFSTALTWAGEKVARLKPNGRGPAGRSPVRMVLEAELMITAVTGKMHGWKTMLDHAEALGVAPAVFEELIEAAEQQRQTLGEVHSYAAQRAFRQGEETFEPQKQQ